MSNPFESGPAEQAKKRFGTLAVIANHVELVTGAGYSVPGLVNKDGESWTFRGKQLKPDARNLHVILTLESTRKDGGAYTAFIDFMYWQSDPVFKATFTALTEQFGEHLEGLHGKKRDVMLQEVTVNDRGYEKVAWQVQRVFKDRAEREVAEREYFAKFSNDTASTDGAIPADVVAFAKQVADLAQKSKLDFVQLVGGDERLSRYGAEALLEAMK